MPNLAVVDMEGKNVGTIELAESVFGIEPNAAVMHQMVLTTSQHSVRAPGPLLQDQRFQAAVKAVETEEFYRPLQDRVQQELRSGHTAALYSLETKRLQIFRKQEVRRLAMKSAFSSKVMENRAHRCWFNQHGRNYKTKKIVTQCSAQWAKKKALIVLPGVDNKVIKSITTSPVLKQLR